MERMKTSVKWKSKKRGPHRAYEALSERESGEQKSLLCSY